MPSLLSPRWYLWIGGALLALSITALVIIAVSGVPKYTKPVQEIAPFIGYALSGALALTSRTVPILCISTLGVIGFNLSYLVFSIPDTVNRSIAFWISLNESVTLVIQTIALCHLWGGSLARMLDVRAIQSQRRAAGVLLAAFAVGGILRLIQIWLTRTSMSYFWESAKAKPAAAVVLLLTQFASLLDMALPFVAALIALRKESAQDDLRRRARRIHVLSLVSTCMVAAIGPLYFLTERLGGFYSPSWSNLCDTPSFALVCALLAIAVGRRCLEDYQKPRQILDPPPVIP